MGDARKFYWALKSIALIRGDTNGSIV